MEQSRQQLERQVHPARRSQNALLRGPAMVAMACVLGLASPSTPVWSQQPSDAQSEEGPSRGGVPGGQMVRGTISSVNGDRLSVKSDSGQTFQVVTTSNTRIMRQRQAIKVTDLRPGDGVGAAGVLDASTQTLHAVMLFAVSAEDIRKAQENLGKTYITGRVIAINELQLTIERPDKVSQVIEVDEGTSFRRGGRGPGAGSLFGGSAEPASPPPQSGAPPSNVQNGESITLADIKVGDNIFATGVLHSSVFHPTELRVANPRRRRAEGSTAAAPSAPNSSH